MKKWRTTLIDRLKNDPNEAEAYLQASIKSFEEDENLAAFLIALRTLVDAKGGIQWLSEETQLNRTQLYRTLSPKGNPTLSSLHRILPALGLKLFVSKI